MSWVEHQLGEPHNNSSSCCAKLENEDEKADILKAEANFIREDIQFHLVDVFSW